MRGRDRVAITASVAALALSVLAVGGALAAVQAVVALLVAGALSAQLLSNRSSDKMSPLLASLLCAAALTALQLVPAPDALVELLNPTGAMLREEGTSLAGVAYWPSLSMDVAGSIRALTYFLILLGVAIVALRFSASQRGRYAICAVVAGTCGLAAAVTAVHELLGATSLFGFYAPTQAIPSVFGPLLNENHLAGLTAMGSVVALGLIFDSRSTSQNRFGWALVCVGCLVVTLASGSRGATLSLIGGIVVALSLWFASRMNRKKDRVSVGRRERFIFGLLPLGIVAFCALVLIVYASAGGVAHELSDTSTSEWKDPRSKFAAWRSAGELIRESPWIGQGRGALETTLTRVNPGSSYATYSHLENEYLQAVVDWGIPGAAVMVLMLGWLTVVILKRGRNDSMSVGAVGALTVVAIQSTVDFGIELLGVAVPAVALAATVAYVPLREKARRAVWISRGIRAGLVVGLLSSAALLCSSIATTVTEDHDAMITEGFGIAQLQESIERHPLDYLGYAQLAAIHLRQNDATGIKYLNHALLLHPTHTGLHLLAARLLRAAGRDQQAALEFSTAIRTQRDPSAIIQEIIASYKDARHAASCIPPDYENVDLIVRILGQLERTDVATAWLSRVLDLRPDDPHVCDLLFEQAIRSGDLKAAEMAARHCTRVNPTRQQRLALARVLFKQGAYAETIQQLEDIASWRGRVSELAGGWLMLCDSHEALERWDAAKRCLRLLDGHGLLAERREEITRRLERISTSEAASALKAEGPENPN